VVHVLETGSRIQRSNQYLIRDTSKPGLPSWEGVYRRNPARKMKGQLLQKSDGARVYREETIDMRKGKVAETNSICEPH
jgi:hypothetical protein